MISSFLSGTVLLMKMTTRRAMIAPIALSMTIAMSACASDDETSDSGTTDSTTTVGSETTSPDDSAAGSPSTGTGSESASAPGSADATTGRTAIALTAIATAEEGTGGVAYEIDDQDDDGTWEVDVRDGDASVEVKLNADGTQILEQENDDLDDDDKAGLDAASITLSEAIQTAINHVGGELDDAELEEDDGQHYWEVSVDTPENDDVEVHVSVNGEILKVDD